MGALKMAEPITIQKLIEASMDSDSLEVLVNGDENAQVTTRTGETYPSAKKAIKTMFENGGLPATPFATKALMEASVLADGDYAQVTDDTVNNGLYLKTAGVWVKSAYDVLNLTSKNIESSLYNFNKRIISSFSNVTSVSETGLSAYGSPFYIADGYVLSSDQTSTNQGEIAILGSFIDTGDIAVDMSVDVSAQTNATAFNGVYLQKSKTSQNGIALVYLSTLRSLRIVSIRSTTINTIASQSLSGVSSGIKTWTYRVAISNSGLDYRCSIVVNGVEYGPLIATRQTSDEENLPTFIGIMSSEPQLKVTDFSAVRTVVNNQLDIEGIEDNLHDIEEVVDDVLRDTDLTAGMYKSTREQLNKTLIRNKSAFDIEYKNSEALLVDWFDGDSPHSISTHTPEYSKLPGYTEFGTAGWIVENGEAHITRTGTGKPSYSGMSGFTAELPPYWYQNMRGVQIKAKVLMPKGGNAVSLVLVNKDGNFVGDNPTALFIGTNGRAVSFYTKTTVDGGTTSGSISYSDVYRPEYTTEDTVIDMVVNCYSSLGRGDTHDLFIAEVDGQRMAKYFFQGDADNTSLSPIRDIDSVGIAINSSSYSSIFAKVLSFEVGPVPRSGSSRYRSLPPEPAPVVPNFSAPSVVFDAATDADPLALVNYQSILGPSIIPMLDYASKLGITPIDNYYMYYSPDHSSGESGIWLATSPNPEGPWTNYVGAKGNNRIYVDTVDGSQTEQPQVVYDEVENRLIMMYHNNGALSSQTSIIATSNNGVDFTRVGPASDISSGLRRGHIKHDGYSSFCAKDPLGISSGWHGWFRLTGGPANSLWSIAHSDDGITWTPDLLPIEIPALSRPQHDQTILHNIGYGSVPFAYRGQRLLPIAPFIAGGTANNDVGYISIVRLGDDMRNMSADEYVIEQTLDTEVGQISVSSVFVRDNTLYLYYTAKSLYVHLITADLSKPPAGINRTIR